MENAATIPGDWLTPKLCNMLNDSIARVIRNGFGEVAIVITKGRITFLKTTESEPMNEVEERKR